MGPASRSKRRALTLLEVLIVIGLLGALFALALPNIVSSLDERAFEAAAEMTTSHLLLARAEAQGSARAIEVRYEPDEPRLEARPFEIDEALVPAADERGSDDAETREVIGASDDGPSILPEAWAYRPLPDGVHLSLNPPETPDEIDPLADAFDDEPENDEPAGAFLLAVYLPDGSVLLGDEVWIRGAGGRAGRLTVNAWTGLPSFERVTADDLEREAEEDDDESEEEEEEEEEEWSAEEDTDAGRDAGTDADTDTDTQPEDTP
ncbi:MAG: hypothetical protein GY715_12410 [Planctomycetes bacterium]|nr:hypothetical protein [Planctomycetota bacterium]